MIDFFVPVCLEASYLGRSGKKRGRRAPPTHLSDGSALRCALKKKVPPLPPGRGPRTPMPRVGWPVRLGGSAQIKPVSCDGHGAAGREFRGGAIQTARSRQSPHWEMNAVINPAHGKGRARHDEERDHSGRGGGFLSQGPPALRGTAISLLCGRALELVRPFLVPRKIVQEFSRLETTTWQAFDLGARLVDPLTGA